MRLPPEFIDEVREALPIEEVAARYTALRKAGRELKGLSPFTRERTPSFFVVPHKKAFFCFSTGINGNVFELVMQAEGLSFRDAVEICASMAGISVPQNEFKRDTSRNDDRKAAAAARAEQRDEQEARRDSKVREHARYLWSTARPIEDGCPAALYLKSRDIRFPERFPGLRAHAGITHSDHGERLFPALLGAVQDPVEGRFLAIQRIYLSQEGHKASVGKGSQKVTLARFSHRGGSVRLGPVTETANVCEGIETGLGIYGLLGCKQGVQAALSTSGMVNFIPPKGCVKVRIWPDGDRDRMRENPRTGEEVHVESPGMKAAHILRDRLKAEGIAVTVQPIPLQGIDFLEIWQQTVRQ